MSSPVVALPAAAAAAAPVTPADAAVGPAWLPYLVVGAGLLVLTLVVGLRSRRRTAALREFLLGRAAALVLIGLLAGWLADAAAEGDGLTAIDRPVWSWFVGHRTGVLTVAAKVVTEVGGTAVMGAAATVVALWLWWREHRRGAAVLVAAVTAGAGLLISVSKPVVGRVRPPTEFQLVSETNQSFPSGHALASIAVLGVLLVVLGPRLRSSGLRIAAAVATVVAVVAIGASRLYLGVHWPTDIAGGWLTGSGWLLVCLTLRTLWARYPAVFPAAVRSRLPRSDPGVRSGRRTAVRR